MPESKMRLDITTDTSITMRTVKMNVYDGSLIEEKYTIRPLYKDPHIGIRRYRPLKAIATKTGNQRWRLSVVLQRVKANGIDSKQSPTVVASYKGYELHSNPTVLNIRAKMMEKLDIEPDNVLPWSSTDPL